MDDNPVIGQLILQLVLILLNAFFASAEIAVISLNEGKLRRQVADGDKLAQKMLRMIEEPTGFLSTIQIGITLAGFLGSAFAADNFSDLIVRWLVNTVGITSVSEASLNTIAVILITLILSFLMLVLGELVPKRIAMRKPEKVARLSCRIITLSKIMRPLIWLLSICTNGILRLFRINPHETDEAVSEAEIRMMVDMGNESGAIETNEKELINNIFEFNDITAQDVMIHRTDMVVLWTDSTHDEIINTIRESGLSRFPVCGEDVDDIVGILRAREYLLDMTESLSKPIIGALTPAYFVPDSVKADVLFRDMQENKVHMAIVVDEYGGTCGLITMEDLIEEIVGNIYDESDPQDEQGITKIEDNLWKIAGGTELVEIVEALGLKWKPDEEDEYETLGGLVFSCLNQIPPDGSKPEVDVVGLHIKVDKLEDHRVEWAMVSKIETNEQVAAVSKDNGRVSKS